MTDITEADHDAVDWLYEMGAIAPHHLRLANEAFARHREQVERQSSNRIEALKAECRNANDCAALALIRIEALEAEIERLREALEAYAARCTICSGGGSIAEEDSITGAYLWRDCPGCTPARAALAGDSHDQ